MEWCQCHPKLQLFFFLLKGLVDNYTSDHWPGRVHVYIGKSQKKGGTTDSLNTDMKTETNIFRIPIKNLYVTIDKKRYAPDIDE